MEQSVMFDLFMHVIGIAAWVACGAVFVGAVCVAAAHYTGSPFQFSVAFDQMLGTLIRGGWADETLSARMHRESLNSDGWDWWRRFTNRLFFWQADHCRAAYESEMSRRQLPPEYRQ